MPGAPGGRRSLPPLLPPPKRVTMHTGMVHDTAPRVSIDRSLPAQGYRLRLGDSGIFIEAADMAGAFYANTTLDQLRHGIRTRRHDQPARRADDAGGGARSRACPGEDDLSAQLLPACDIEDWPDFALRGVMLDVSRCKVPTMETVYDLVDRLASWKFNQLQLYTEHSFSYKNHSEVWRDSSPFSAEEIEALDAYCAKRFVELVANQNCLGHMERWLVHSRYRDLALQPEGFDDPFGLRRPPSTVDPTRHGSMDLVRELLGELLPHFTSPRVHVGLDEPWELPPGRVDDYVTWLQSLRSLPELAGHEMLVWGDVLALHPDVLHELPERVTVCEWGYDAGHPFAERLDALRHAGHQAWVCPGTSSWLSILGRTTNMMANCAEAADQGIAHGATGYLLTDWGDFGHIQYQPVSEPGFAYGAARAWSAGTGPLGDSQAAEREWLVTALDLHGFDDPTRNLSRSLIALGDVYSSVPLRFPNMSTLVMNFYFPQLPVGMALTQGLTADHLLAVEAGIDSEVRRAASAIPRRAGGGLVVEELKTGADLVSLCCEDARARLDGDGTLESVSASTRAHLRQLLGRVKETHRDLWLARNRPGGLDESLAWMAHLEQCYETGETDPRWSGPMAEAFFAPTPGREHVAGLAP